MINIRVNKDKELLLTAKEFIKGDPGKDGKDGKDGYTPIKGVDYFDGKDGAPGPAGPAGPQGPAGKDGKDGAITFSEADKAEIVQLIMTGIPEAEEVKF